MCPSIKMTRLITLQPQYKLIFTRNIFLLLMTKFHFLQFALWFIYQKFISTFYIHQLKFYNPVVNIDFIRDIFAEDPAFNESPIAEPRTRVSSGSFRNITRVSAPFIDTRAISQTHASDISERQREKERESVRFMRLLGSLYFIRQIDGNVKTLAPLAHALAAGCGLLGIYLRVIHLCIFLSCTSQNTFHSSRLFVVLVPSISHHFSLHAILLFILYFLNFYS